MTKHIVSTAKAPQPLGSYSQGVKAGGFVFVAGQPLIDPATGQLAGPTIAQQTSQCLRNVAAVLEAAGSSLERVVSATVILAEMADFAGMNEEWAQWFPTDGPARQGARLPSAAFKISIAVVAEA